MSGELSREYRGRVVFGPFAPFSRDEVQALEREVGRPLPPSYMAFAEVANDGLLEYAIRVPPTADGEIISFRDLWRLGCDDNGEYGWGTILGEYRRQSGWQIAEEFLLPIARTGGEDDTLFVDLSHENYGRVCGYVSGLPPAWGKRTDSVLAYLADSFDEYLDALFIDPDMAEFTWADVADLDAADSWRRTVEAWLDKGLPEWRTLPWAG